MPCPPPEPSPEPWGLVGGAGLGPEWMRTGQPLGSAPVRAGQHPGWGCPRTPRWRWTHADFRGPIQPRAQGRHRPAASRGLRDESRAAGKKTQERRAMSLPAGVPSCPAPKHWPLRGCRTRPGPPLRARPRQSPLCPHGLSPSPASALSQVRGSWPGSPPSVAGSPAWGGTSGRPWVAPTTPARAWTPGSQRPP